MDIKELANQSILPIKPYVPGKSIKQALSEIDLFSDFLDADKLERYRRLKDFAPDYVLPYLRRYKKEKMRNVKKKSGWFYHPYSFTKNAPELQKGGDAE